MATARITKRRVDALRCKTGKDRVFLWDDALAGFGVSAFPSGTKVYVAQFRKDGRSRRIAIGDHGRLTPEEARSEAKKLLGAVEKGADPVAERRAASGVRTFREAADEFMRRHVASKRKARTHYEYELLLKVHIFPKLGSRRITDVRRVDVARLHAGLSDRPFVANRCLALVSSIWNWAARGEEVQFTGNPAKGIDRYPERGRERYLTSKEFERLGNALRTAETIGLPWTVDETKPKQKHAPKLDKRRTVADPFAVAAIRLLILTGARLREILHARWESVDFERGIIHLGDSKTGRKPIYLSAAALSVLFEFASDRRQPVPDPRRKGWSAARRFETALGRNKEGGEARGCSHSRYATFVRFDRSRCFNGPADHRPLARTLTASNHREIFPPSGGPASPGCRHDRRNNFGGNGGQASGGSCALEAARVRAFLDPHGWDGHPISRDASPDYRVLLRSPGARMSKTYTKPARLRAEDFNIPKMIFRRGFRPAL